VRLFQQSDIHYKKGEFRQAVELLTEAYRLDPQPVILYNLGRANEGLGDLEAAATAYERYLREEKDVPDRGAIETRIATLRAQLAEYQRLAADREHERLARADVEAQLAEARPARVWPWVVTGVGAATLVAGAVLGALAMNRHRSAEGSASQLDAQTLQQEAERLATGANIAFAAGAAVTVAGAIWLLWPQTEPGPRPRAQAWLSPMGGGIFLRF
jgi:tetratricopeptide (TPR) repeat protein